MTSQNSNSTVDATTTNDVISAPVIGAVSSTNAGAQVATSAPAASVFTVKEGDTVKGTIANIKKHPEKGVLVVIDGNPMSFMPNGCIAGRSDEEKLLRRADLIANPGTVIDVTVMSPPSSEIVKKLVRGKEEKVLVHRIKVSEQRAVQAAERIRQTAQLATRRQEIESTVASLVPGTVIEGTVRGAASKDSDRPEGGRYTYGLFVNITDNVSGLLHVKHIAGGMQALEAFLKAGKVTVEIVEAKLDDRGQPRVQLSQKSIAAKAATEAFFKRYPVDCVLKGEVVSVGDVVGNMKGRFVRLASGDEVFLSDDNLHVKNAEAVGVKKTTRVKITGEIVDGVICVTRQGL